MGGNMIRRKSVGIQQSLCVQPTFIVGTYDEYEQVNFAPITWVSVTWDKENFLIVISMFGNKKTKKNVLITKYLSLNLVSTDMIPLVEYLGSSSGNDGFKDKKTYDYSEGEVLHVPTLSQSKWVYECEVVKTVTTGDSDTFFCEIKNVQVDETIDISDGVNLTSLDPVIYSGHYHSIGEHMGRLGDYIKEAL